MRNDQELIQIVDAAMAEAVRKSGSWLLCRAGCHECCLGAFPITPLDAQRLRSGLAELERSDPRRAGRVRMRAQASAERLRREYPAEALHAILDLEDEDEACPALDPDSGTCDLYSVRPITCRTFGPPVRFASDSLAVCELCFRGAPDAEIAACEVVIPPDDWEGQLLEELEATTGACGETIVAFALAAAS